MKKALYCGLSAALLLALVLVACNKPQADQPTEPDPTQAVTSTPEPEQTPEPVTTPEPPEQIPAAPEQLSGTTQADPSQPPEETAPQEPAQTTPPAPENTQKPTTNTAPQESQPTIVEPEPAPEPEPEEDTQTPGTAGSMTPDKDNWDNEVYAMLTPEQKAVYESADGSTRAYFNRSIKDKAILDSQGWTTEWDTHTGEELAETWSHISME